MSVLRSMTLLCFSATLTIVTLCIGCADSEYRSLPSQTSGSTGDTSGAGVIISEGPPPCSRLSDAGYVRTRNPGTGIGETYWTSEDVLSGLEIIVSPANDDLSVERTRSAILNAILTWREAADACGNQVFSLNESQDQVDPSAAIGHDPNAALNYNIIFFTSDVDAWDAAYSKTKIAVTNSTIRVTDGVIVDADLELNDAYFTFTSGGGDGVDLESVVVHELGHFLGFDHTQDEESVMYGKTQSSGAYNKSELSEDDALGLCEAFACYKQ